jgi:hypothetical protein
VAAVDLIGRDAQSVANREAQPARWKEPVLEIRDCAMWVRSDGGIVSGGEFERSCGMSGRSEDVPDLSSLCQGVEERSTDEATIGR